MKILFCSGNKLKLSVAIAAMLLFALLASALLPHGWIAASGQQERLVPIYEVATKEPKVAISFDASWGAEHTRDILDTLDKYNVKATFFLVNIWLEDYPELAQEIVQRGHEIGLHTATHPHLPELSEDKILSELTDNCEMIKEITGYTPTLFRPPFGDYSNSVIEVASANGYDTIQWSVDTMV